MNAEHHFQSFAGTPLHQTCIFGGSGILGDSHWALCGKIPAMKLDPFDLMQGLCRTCANFLPHLLQSPFKHHILWGSSPFISIATCTLALFSWHTVGMSGAKHQAQLYSLGCLSMPNKLLTESASPIAPNGALVVDKAKMPLSGIVRKPLHAPDTNASFHRKTQGFSASFRVILPIGKKHVRDDKRPSCFGFHDSGKNLRRNPMAMILAVPNGLW